MSDSIGIIASDLTGGMDTAAAFARSPNDTIVLLGSEHEAASDNTILVTDSAAVPPAEAYARVRRATAHLAQRQLFKKIDSTLRGNVGPELRAVLDESEGARTLVCPALPREGRIVIGGVALLHGVPVHLTSYGTHPLTPSRVSDVRALLRQSGVDSILVELEDVRRGPNHLRQLCASTHCEAIVVDAETDDDLRVIAAALPQGDSRWVACGSSGLAAAVAAASGTPPERFQHRASDATLPAFAVIGSRNPTTVAQVQALATNERCVITSVDAAELVNGSPHGQSARWVEPVVGALAGSLAAVLTTSLSPLVDHHRAEIAMRLGDMARMVTEQAAIGVCILSGGSTAWSVCRSLGVEALAVSGEVERGIVAAIALDGTSCGMRFITKVGGFGDESALMRLVAPPR